MKEAPQSSRTFLLSPALCSGRRGQLLMNASGTFRLGQDVAQGAATLGEVFAFVSGLYFRGKLTYARAFAGSDGSSVHVITPTRGLQPPDVPVSVAVLREFAEVNVDSTEERYRQPLARDAAALHARIGPDCDVVLLGSIATSKYVEPLAAVFGARLRFPLAFVGRGDMSRGALMLRAAQEGRELEYVPVLESRRHGPRAPRIDDTR